MESAGLNRGGFAERLARELGLAQSPAVADILQKALRPGDRLDLPEEFRVQLGELGSGATADAQAVERISLAFASRLWSRAGDAAEYQASASQPGVAVPGRTRGDDVLLYWSRLRMLNTLCDVRGLTQAAREAILRGFDSVSRNLKTPAGLQSRESAAEPLVWITGFDPYGLDPQRPETCANTNPSGAAALALHGRRFRGASGLSFSVHSAIFPVRFADFTEGRLEAFLEERVLAAANCEFCFTISMGGAPDAFHIDRFPGNCRGTSPDNAGQIAGPASILLEGAPSFVEHSLSDCTLRKMQATAAADRAGFAVCDYRCVEVEAASGGRSALEPATIAELEGLRAVRGAGGDYLSNEITFRVLQRLARGSRPELRSAHIHTPRLKDGGVPVEIEKRDRIVAQIEAMLCAIM